MLKKTTFKKLLRLFFVVLAILSLYRAGLGANEFDHAHTYLEAFKGLFWMILGVIGFWGWLCWAKELKT